SAGVLNGRATYLPTPEFPAAAAAVNARGSVVVQILIGRSGAVESARAISGHPLLRPAAEQAAMEATFAPVTIDGKPIRVNGTVEYRFIDADHSKLRLQKMKVETPKEEAKAAKFHFWLYDLIERLQKRETSPTPNES